MGGEGVEEDVDEVYGYGGGGESREEGEEEGGL